MDTNFTTFQIFLKSNLKVRKNVLEYKKLKIDDIISSWIHYMLLTDLNFDRLLLLIEKDPANKSVMGPTRLYVLHTRATELKKRENADIDMPFGEEVVQAMEDCEDHYNAASLIKEAEYQYRMGVGKVAYDLLWQYRKYTESKKSFITNPTKDADDS